MSQAQLSNVDESVTNLMKHVSPKQHNSDIKVTNKT